MKGRWGVVADTKIADVQSLAASRRIGLHRMCLSSLRLWRADLMSLKERIYVFSLNDKQILQSGLGDCNCILYKLTLIGRKSHGKIKLGVQDFCRMLIELIWLEGR